MKISKNYEKNFIEKFVEANIRIVIISIIFSILLVFVHLKYGFTNGNFWLKNFSTTFQKITETILIFIWVVKIFLIPLIIISLNFYFKNGKYSLKIENLIRCLMALFFIISALDLFFSFAPNIYNSTLTEYIAKFLLPYIKESILKFWTSIIIGIIIPGVLGNFAYDLLKTFIFKWLKIVLQK